MRFLKLKLFQSESLTAFVYAAFLVFIIVNHFWLKGLKSESHAAKFNEAKSDGLYRKSITCKDRETRPPNCGGFSLFLHHLWGKHEHGARTHPPYLA